MSQLNKKGRRPDFSSSDGCAVWINKDKNGKDYLSIQLFGGQIKIAAFKNEPKVEHPEEIQEITQKEV